MMIVGQELQLANVDFLSVQPTTTRDGQVLVTDFVAASDEDLASFHAWAAENDVRVDSAHVADPVDVQRAAEMAW